MQGFWSVAANFAFLVVHHARGARGLGEQPGPGSCARRRCDRSPRPRRPASLTGEDALVFWLDTTSVRSARWPVRLPTSGSSTDGAAFLGDHAGALVERAGVLGLIGSSGRPRSQDWTLCRTPSARARAGDHLGVGVVHPGVDDEPGLVHRPVPVDHLALVGHGDEVQTRMWRKLIPNGSTRTCASPGGRAPDAAGDPLPKPNLPKWERPGEPLLACSAPRRWSRTRRLRHD